MRKRDMTAVRRQACERGAATAGRMLLTMIGVVPLVAMLSSPVAAQLDLRSYSASGMHQCSSGQPASCVVTGSRYRDCIEATSALRAQDCCLTRRDSSSHSTGFTLNYCIPESGIGR